MWLVRLVGRLAETIMRALNEIAGRQCTLCVTCHSDCIFHQHWITIEKFWSWEVLNSSHFPAKLQLWDYMWCFSPSFVFHACCVRDAICPTQESWRLVGSFAETIMRALNEIKAGQDAAAGRPSYHAFCISHRVHFLIQIELNWENMNSSHFPAKLCPSSRLDVMSLLFLRISCLMRCST